MRASRRSIAFALFLVLSLSFAFCQDESLGDTARRVRDQHKDDVLVDKDDAKQLFQSINKILEFSSECSGFPRRSAVNHKMVGRPEVEKHFADSLKAAAKEERLEESQLVLKKFGLLPADFDLESFLNKNSAKSLGGFYDFRDKTMYLLNWIPLDRQKDIMAHELTHALQDQNHDLMKFEYGGAVPSAPAAARMAVDTEADEAPEARRAIIEGQAEIVHFDYLLQPFQVSLSDGSGALEFIQDAITSSYDTAVVFHNAPRLLRDTSIFPYREGFGFELELLKRGGRSMAFATPFARPPRDTHEVLQPEAYINGTHVAPVKIVDLSPILGSDYVAYDSGTLGELDVQIMSQEFGIENDIYSVARKWNGGAYVAVKKASHPKDAPMTTADLALIYLSRWTTEKAADRFAQIYLDSLGKRMQITESPTISTHECETAKCPSPLWEAHLKTCEGPVNIEVWPKATVLITQSLDDATVSKLRIPLLVAPEPKKHAMQVSPYHEDELAMRLFESSSFADLADQRANEINDRVLEQLRQYEAAKN